MITKSKAAHYRLVRLDANGYKKEREALTEGVSSSMFSDDVLADLNSEEVVAYLDEEFAEKGPHYAFREPSRSKFGAEAWDALSLDEGEKLERELQEGPVQATTGLWMFRGDVYEADPDLTADDVKALIFAKENERRLRLEKAHALMAMTERLDPRAKRQVIPREIKLAVWQRDGGRCVDCESQTDLEYDHVIPLALGGSNSERNLQLLCAVCNRRKGPTLG